MKTYKKISKEYLPYFGRANVYFNDEVIGKINLKTDLELNITENWQDYTSDSTGGNTLESKLTSIMIDSSIELIRNISNQERFIESIKTKPELNKTVSVINIDSLGNSGKKGELKIIPYEDKSKTIIIYNCIIKSTQSLGLNVDNQELIQLNFTAIPKMVNGDYRLIQVGEEEFIRNIVIKNIGANVINFGLESTLNNFAGEEIVTYTIPVGYKTPFGVNYVNSIVSDEEPSNLYQVFEYGSNDAYRAKIDMVVNSNTFITFSGEYLKLLEYETSNNTITEIDDFFVTNSNNKLFNDDITILSNSSLMVVTSDDVGTESVFAKYIAFDDATGNFSVTKHQLIDDLYLSDFDFTFKMSFYDLLWFHKKQNNIEVARIEYLTGSNVIRINPTSETVIDTADYDYYTCDILFESVTGAGELFAVGYSSSEIKYYIINFNVFTNNYSLEYSGIFDLGLGENETIKEVIVNGVDPNNLIISYITQIDIDTDFCILRTKFYEIYGGGGGLNHTPTRIETITSNYSIKGLTGQKLSDRLVLVYNEQLNINKKEIEI